MVFFFWKGEGRRVGGKEGNVVLYDIRLKKKNLRGGVSSCWSDSFREWYFLVCKGAQRGGGVGGRV